MKKLALTLILTICLVACNDKLIDNQPPQNEFSLKIIVKDSQGNPVPDLKVSVWNKLTIYNNLLTKTHDKKTILSGSTTIQFALKETSFVNMNAYDLENNLYDTLINQKLLPGNYNYNWQNSKPNQVYKILFNAKADSLFDSLNYRDSIYVVNHSPDPSVAEIGKTDENGKFETNSKLLFPSLYNLPELNWTISSGFEIIAKFSLLDSVIIALTETVKNTTQYNYFKLENNENDAAFIWNSSFTKNSKSRKNNKSILVLDMLLKQDSIPIIGIPKENRLYQNFPNPFN
jgi:hypothetical protein